MNRAETSPLTSHVSPFGAICVSEDSSRTIGNIVQTTLDALDPGSVVIRTAFSGINYKDALAVTGGAPIVSRLNRSSSDPRFSSRAAVRLMF